jgi:hypothetical protein
MYVKACNFTYCFILSNEEVQVFEWRALRIFGSWGEKLTGNVNYSIKGLRNMINCIIIPTLLN